MDCRGNQQMGQPMRNVISQRFGKITKHMIALRSVLIPDLWPKCCGTHEQGVPARYYQGKEIKNPVQYNSKLLRGLCYSPVGQNSSVWAVQHAFNHSGSADNKWLTNLCKPEEQITSLNDDANDAMAPSADANAIWHLHDIYSQTISEGNQTPVSNEEQED